ncbi:MAG: DNA cytosine methyltransferase, partial [Parcubacteria group bacterium]
MKSLNKKPRVVDFFCGGGGFSEGFRQQGFEVVMGIDNWAPAIETHNINHGLSDKKKDVLDFGSSLKEIENLPNTEIIVGSPPCVLFSLSNKGGKADKTLGIKLIESFLRVIAIKKHQKSSVLAAWFMENVPNSKNYIKPVYTFRDLNLVEWAKNNKINPDKIAINGSVNGRVLNTADFGASQKRSRFVCGEIVSNGKFPNIDAFITKEHRSIGTIKNKMPKPNMSKSLKLYSDPNYPQLKLKMTEITDHFYDSGVYASQWKSAQYAKLNHPFMGKMSFPEDEDNPSRTIMATLSASTREALLYKSEYNRRGDGKYRLPTIREVATLMGFPYTYQFSGGQNTKWRQIGNAVCPHMSSALAKSVRISMNLKPLEISKVSFKFPKINDTSFQNLNTFEEKKFDTPPQKKSTARFRKHPFKEGNMTVALTNFNPSKATNSDNTGIEWYSSVFMGSGKDFVLKVIPKNGFKKIAELILKHNSDLGNKFIKQFDKKFYEVIGKTSEFQNAYIKEKNVIHEPGKLVDEISDFISNHVPNQQFMLVPNLVPNKDKIPTKQVFAM